ncbi:MAG: SpvB/TcaC N-terminal domain-containing protein, partial [Bacillota bacterium]
MSKTKKVQKCLLSIILATLILFQSMTSTVLSSSPAQGLKSFADDVLNDPESPVPQSFDPTSIKDIKAADPGSKVNLIEPPEVNNQGNAQLSYPIEVPPGRNGMQAQVGISYNSEGENGWLGLGWDLSMSSISIDTRWGVPRYWEELETETYILDGAQLSPVAYKSDYVPREANKQFYSTIEGDFKKIIRHGNSPDNYWWEVTTKNGIRYFYGGTPEQESISPNQVLSDPERRNIFRWPLVQVRDRYGNTVDYEYQRVGDSTTGVQLYPKAVYYTGRMGDHGAYKVEFVIDEFINPIENIIRPDVIIDARPGFKTLTKHLLKEIKVSFKDDLIRRYTLDYITGEFNKTLLKEITQFDGSGIKFNSHSFDYY